jgi:hypothetical protein
MRCLQPLPLSQVVLPLLKGALNYPRHLSCVVLTDLRNGRLAVLLQQLDFGGAAALHLVQQNPKSCKKRFMIRWLNGSLDVWLNVRTYTRLNDQVLGNGDPDLAIIPS